MEKKGVLRSGPSGHLINETVRISIPNHLNSHQPWIRLSPSFHHGNYLVLRSLCPLSNMSVKFEEIKLVSVCATKLEKNAIYKPDNGMHLLPNIHIGVPLDRLVDGNSATWPKLLNVQHAYTPDDTISCKETVYGVCIIG